MDGEEDTLAMVEEPPWVAFDAIIEALPWGRSVYTIIRVPPALETVAGMTGTRRVEGTIDDVRVNLGINRADIVDQAFMYAGKALQRRLGAGTGDLVSCRLRPADPDDVPLDDDVRRALADAGRLHAFLALEPARQRRLLHPISAAVRPQTRRQRLESLIESLPRSGSSGP
jgi:hypothetical protein